MASKIAFTKDSLAHSGWAVRIPAGTYNNADDVVTVTKRDGTTETVRVVKVLHADEYGTVWAFSRHLTQVEQVATPAPSAVTTTPATDPGPGWSTISRLRSPSARVRANAAADRAARNAALGGYDVRNDLIDCDYA